MFRKGIALQLISQHKRKLLVTYLLFSLEMAGSLLRPFFLGMAINDLMKGSYDGLILLSIVHFVWLLMGTARQMYDTRTYSAIYTTLVTRFLSRRYGKTDVSRLSAHSTLSKELVDFMETDLPYVMEAIYNIIGSLILLCFYDYRIVLPCMAILLPVMAISYFYGKKMRRLTRLKNDELEKQVSIISAGNNASINQHYNKLRKWQIKISDKEAINFGLIEMLVLIVIGFSLLISTNVFGAGLLAGNLVGIYNYVLRFVSGLDSIPYTVQRITALNDIARRIEIQEEDIDTSVLQKTATTIPVWQQGELKLSA
jgi:ABC-type multidrug transport system fused ATPase/permease subunit